MRRSGQLSRRWLGPLLSCLALLAVAAADASAATVKPLQSYGVNGSAAAGGVSGASGMDVNPISGDLVIADNEGKRIEVFSPAGKFLRAFGKDVAPAGGDGPEVCTRRCQEGKAGDGAGELDEVSEVEVSPNGKLVYVEDREAHRVSVFTMQGKFRFAFGTDVDPGGGDGPEVCRRRCQAGSTTADAGNAAMILGLAFGPDGDLFASSWELNRIDRFTAGGTPVAAYGHDVNTAGGSGGFEACRAQQCSIGGTSGAGALRGPRGIDFDPQGRIWVGSMSDNYVSVVTPAPSFEFALGEDVDADRPGFGTCQTECTLGAAGSGPGGLERPQAISVDARGTAYVTDDRNNRVSAYAPNGAFRFAFGYDVIPGGGDGLEICTADTDCQAGTPQGALFYPGLGAVDCRGTVFTGPMVHIFLSGEAPSPAAVTAFGLSRKAKPGPCRLKLGKAKLNRRRGTAKLKVLVPYAGKVVLNGKGIKRARGSHTGLEGNEKLAVKPGKKLKRKLRRRGKARVRVTVKMRPSDGNVVQKRSKRIVLKAKKKKRGRR